jgi:type VI secretion system protein ImpL
VFKYIFAFLVIAIAWTLAILLREKFPPGITVAIVVTAVAPAGGLVAVILYRRYKAIKAAREIEKALNAQAEEQARAAPRAAGRGPRDAGGVHPRHLVAEVSKLGKSGAEALYALPWYVIIGPPGAGKTTALRNSGSSSPTCPRRPAAG